MWLCGHVAMCLCGHVVMLRKDSMVCFDCDSYLMGYALCRRPPIIAHRIRIAESWHCCKRILASLVPTPVIWHVGEFNFVVLRNFGTIVGHLGAQQRTLWGPCSGFLQFSIYLGASVWKFVKCLGPKKVFVYVFLQVFLSGGFRGLNLDVREREISIW